MHRGVDDCHETTDDRKPTHMSDLKLAVQSPETTDQPFLTHEKSLSAKVAKGSEARDILDQQILWLGSQCVSQLYSLIRTARIHDRANAALNQPVNAILAIVKTLGHDGPVVLRFQNDFFFFGDMHLKMNVQQISVFTGLMDTFTAWKMGAVSFSPSTQAGDLREFAYLLVTLDPDAVTVQEFERQLKERGVESIGVEEAKGGVGKRTDRHSATRSLAKSGYAQAAGAVHTLSTSLREGRTPNFKQAKRAIENLVDLLKYDESILLGLTTLRCHDEYTHNHSVNVCVLSLALANRAGYSKVDLADLGLAALFHDSGKSSIPLEVLNKPTELTEDDWQMMRSHPTEGVVNLIRLRGITNLPGRMASASFEHHMNFDFSGYPKLTVPWSQSLTGRILTIADCYDAMTSARVYRREPIPPEKVLKIMFAKSGQSFDATLLKLFVNCVGIVPIGSLVLLNTNELAVVLKPNPNTTAAQQPIIKLITDPQGEPLEDGPEVDLAETDADGQYLRWIMRLVDNTEYRFDTSRYFV
jgi:HD-GYP domain-containing protein (c-di-GMP phosphodiesterase class II)